MSQVTAPGEIAKWERRQTFLPLVSAGQHPVFLDETNTLRALVAPNFDGGKVAFLPFEAKALVSAANQTSARVFPKNFGLRQLEVEVEASEPSLLVVSQTYYHCWRAFVDEQPARLLRANYAFQAVQFTAGRHRVRLAYEDRAFRLGAVVSGLTLLGCVAAPARGRAKWPLGKRINS